MAKRSLKTSDTKQITFFGGGINASRMLVSVGSSRIPYQPQGATWPFALLKISNKSVRYSIALLGIRKNANLTTATVRLGKLGYLYFRTPSGANDFGFTTFRLGSVIRELRTRGYQLDKSCERNFVLARASIFSQIALVAAFIALVIIRPNG